MPHPGRMMGTSERQLLLALCAWCAAVNECVGGRVYCVFPLPSSKVLSTVSWALSGPCPGPRPVGVLVLDLVLDPRDVAIILACWSLPAIGLSSFLPAVGPLFFYPLWVRSFLCCVDHPSRRSGPQCSLPQGSPITVMFTLSTHTGCSSEAWKNATQMSCNASCLLLPRYASLDSTSFRAHTGGVPAW